MIDSVWAGKEHGMRCQPTRGVAERRDVRNTTRAGRGFRVQTGEIPPSAGRGRWGRRAALTFTRDGSHHHDGPRIDVPRCCCRRKNRAPSHRKRLGKNAKRTSSVETTSKYDEHSPSSQRGTPTRPRVCPLASRALLRSHQGARANPRARRAGGDCPRPRPLGTSVVRPAHVSQAGSLLSHPQFHTTPRRVLGS